jgi:hypothetical protein
MPTISTYVDVDVDLGEFDTSELIDELESRGLHVSDNPLPEMEALDKYELEYLLSLVDNAEKRYYNYYKVRDKLNNLF